MTIHTDPRLLCRPCFSGWGYDPHRPSIAVPATHLVPQHTGGDVDEPAAWIPACPAHAANWQEDVDEDELLPILPMPL